MYNGVIGPLAPEEAKMAAFADDLLAVVIANHSIDVEVYVAQKSVGLTLLNEQTEVVSITIRRKKNTLTVEVGGYTYISKWAIRYPEIAMLTN